MALKATIFKISLNIADMDRHYYADHNLVVARHPSETDERMMFRVLAFAAHASEQLAFTKGISTDDEPDIWEKSLSDEIELWIDLGQPDEKRLRRACGRAKQVILFNYGGRTADMWWSQHQTMIKRFKNLRIFNIPEAAGKELAQLIHKNMELQCIIQEGQIWFSNHQHNLLIELEQRY